MIPKLTLSHGMVSSRTIIPLLLYLEYSTSVGRTMDNEFTTVNINWIPGYNEMKHQAICNYNSSKISPN